jgi:uncharacterized membrane protein YcaP (DUF421 family)
LILTIVVWDYVLDWLGFSSKIWAKILEPEKLKVIENGKFLRKNMDTQLITPDQLESQMRFKGIEDVSQVKVAYLESGGDFSFIRIDDADSQTLTDERSKDKT